MTERGSKVVIGCDHAGRTLAAALEMFLKSQKYKTARVGDWASEKVDYPAPAQALARHVVAHDCFGVLVCGSGVGVSMAANRIVGARAALVSEPLSAELARAHNDANIICLGERLTGRSMAEACVKVFLETAFEGGRHDARVQMIDNNTE